MFILRRMREEYHAKGKSCVRVLWTQRKVLTVPRNMLELAIRKKGIPEVLVISVMSLYDGAMTGVRVDSELPEEFEVKM